MDQIICYVEWGLRYCEASRAAGLLRGDFEFVSPRLITSARSHVMPASVLGEAGMATENISLTSAHVSIPLTSTHDRLQSFPRDACQRPGYFNDKQLTGVTVAERLACSPPTKAIQVQTPTGSLRNSGMWESCRTMSLVGGFSCGSPVFPALSFRRCSILISVTLIGSQDLDLNDNRPPWVLVSNDGKAQGRIHSVVVLWRSSRRVALLEGISTLRPLLIRSGGHNHGDSS
ncbi:hypothetical protein PR048_016625 [Dryococelus australis]|uniref:Uncharacterized protein n=1 Tax=Dryococelus australis TaxID=614101 RepID=A0ABQ9H785_9NEOP|nr:hypothetical protein PR048_016625 [Dryococelus australis]